MAPSVIGDRFVINRAQPLDDPRYVVQSRGHGSSLSRNGAECASPGPGRRPSLPGRAHLIDALEQGMAGAAGCGVEILALLIGGSFTDLHNPAPGDIDAISFYRRADAAPNVDARGLAALQQRGRRVRSVRRGGQDGDTRLATRPKRFRIRNGSAFHSLGRG
jgi:uncharacterized protein DUF6932